MFFKIVILILFKVLISEGCISRSYGEDSIVCVCNATYCDTIPQPERVEPTKFLKYTTNKAGLRFQKEEGSFAHNQAPLDNAIVISELVDYQEILGWGGAFTDATGINVKSLHEDAQEHLLRSYFSDDGLEYSLCRVPIGGTDFSTRSYSYDDGPVDKDLVNFELAPEDFDYKIPLIKRALEMSSKKFKLFASVWTAPKWMKTNGEQNGFGFLLEDMYQTWANYFIKFLESYRKEGIEFWGLTTGNEPSLAFALSAINNVGWWPDQMNNWIVNHFGPTIRNSSFSDLKLMALDDQRIFLPWILNTILNYGGAAEYIDGIAVHWYLDSLYSVDSLTETHNAFSGKFILNTEACNGVIPLVQDVRLGLWKRAETYAVDIIKDLHNWVGGWVDWNMALDLQGGPNFVDNFVDAAIIVNATSGEFLKQPMFYALGHFTKFIPKGSVRIFTSNIDDDILAVAFKKPDGGKSVVILNTKEEPTQVNIEDDVSGSIQLELSEKSITTLLYW